jgi:prepilin-type N-terminal cleavage/methylation domain-containing protein
MGKTKRKNFAHSFTLIEFLVVIAIIGVLAALTMTTMTQGRAKARDARRLADTAS